ncbi:OmpA family protein [Tolypothrix sp. VBCCA 56010]|uniref:OmpA family protein n=1 Tax=Tolypothrix sp. VBCCA 56010 TaxID=3137731 RepID=UPI003D7D0CB2
MTQVESMTQDEAVQLDNFLNLLVELNIIDPHESSYSKLLPATVELEECEAESESSVIYLEATLEHPNSFEQPHLDNELEKNTPLIANLEPHLNETNQNNSQDTIDAWQKLQELLVGTELTDLNNIAASIQQNLTKLEHQIYDPKELINLLLPSISELLRLKITESKEEIAQIIAPIVDQAIRSRSEEDKNSMGSALASAVPIAITQQIMIAPEEVSDAFAPTMGRAIKKQIEIEENVVVDALYPIIGSTISKYMAETIHAINQQVEETLSVEGIKRKILAKLQGVSEAELILKEALPFTVQAIFLIHKESGLVISDIQPKDGQRLESDMVAGMLTAIRTFANDCITQSGSVSELDAINYGTSKIILEVAGYCYLAIVIQGEATQEFIWKMRESLTKLVTNYGKLIEQFDGDSDTIPSQIHTTLSTLKDDYQGKNKKKKPSSLLILSLSIISAIFIPWGIWQYHNQVIRSIENKTSLALASTPELAVYRLTVKENHGKLKLTGRLPNQVLRGKAEQITKATAPKWSIDNQIISVKVPPDPVLAAAEVKRVTAVLNQIDGTTISAQYLAGKVSVEGTVNQIADAKIITQAFEQIPGINFVSSAVQIEKVRVAVRFYFELNSATVIPADLENKVKQVKFFLEQHPMKHLKIIGYSYSVTNTIQAQQLALARAKAVQQALINQGVEPSRLQVVATTNLPPGIDMTQPSWLNRCVALEPIDK